MSILITVLLTIAGIVALLFIIALFTKKEYAIVRNININKSKDDVFNYIKLLRNQDYFSKWVMTDPNMKKTFTGTDGIIGFIYAWDGNKKAGAGEQEIKKIREGERIDTEVRFIRPFAGLANLSFTTTPVTNNQTTVTWGMTSSMKYPMNIMLLLMNMEKMLGNDMETSLNTLKGILEK